MNFIHSSQIDTNFCDRVIEWFDEEEKNGFTREGEIGTNSAVDKDIKDSVDHILQYNEELFLEYVDNHLNQCVMDYIQKFKYSADVDNFSINNSVNVQKYYPNGGFKKWHCERFAAVPHIANRHLVFMTYLNDVSDQGETEWFYQDYKVKPKKGHTVIWPADWTHTHRGIPSPTETKYIITGWLEFLSLPEFIQQ